MSAEYAATELRAHPPYSPMAFSQKKLNYINYLTGAPQGIAIIYLFQILR